MARIGLTLPRSEDLPRQEIVEVVQQAEALGYDSVWVGESWGRDGFTWLTQLACHTTRIKLATGITTVFSRAPALIAQTVAALDEISAGRVILGLGTSGPLVIENWHGLPFERPLRRTREYIEIIRLILSGERVNYQGEIFQLKGFRLPFAPVRSRVPIYVASLGPQNLRLTGNWPMVGCRSTSTPTTSTIFSATSRVEPRGSVVAWRLLTSRRISCHVFRRM